jgi:hypothetical protein
MNAFLTFVAVVDGIPVVCGAVVFFVKPLRNKFFKDKEQRNGIMCLLRKDMLDIYYANKDSKHIREYEYKNFISCYEAYKAMGGNSFIDHIKVEVDDFEIER